MQLEVDPHTGRYIGYPPDCTYVADCTLANGVACVVDATDIGVRSFPAYVNHSVRYANADLKVQDDVVVLQMRFPTPAGVPVYVNYGHKYVSGREIFKKEPPDAWTPPNFSNGNTWTPPRR